MYVFKRSTFGPTSPPSHVCYRTVWNPPTTGFCAAIGLSVPWSANYGAFQESLILVRCRFEDQVGYFAPVVFLDSRSSIPAGREIYGTPKVFAEMTVSMEERVMYTDTRLAGTAALSIRSTMHRTATLEDFPNLSPSWRLKVIPRADGPQADICQLIDGSEATSENHDSRLSVGRWRRRIPPDTHLQLGRLHTSRIFRRTVSGNGLHGRIRTHRSRFSSRTGLLTRQYRSPLAKQHGLRIIGTFATRQ